MSEKELQLTLKTPDQIHYDGPAQSVLLGTTDGVIEIFPQHAPLISTIGFSKVRIKSGSHETDFLVRQGLVMVDPTTNSVNVLAYACDKFAEADARTIGEYAKFILAKLGKKEDLNKYQLSFLEGEKVALDKMLEVLKPEPGKKD